MNIERASPMSPSPQEVTMGMETTPLPSFSITSSIFRLLKSLDLQSVGFNLNMIPSIHPIMGWEMVVYDPVVVGRD